MMIFEIVVWIFMAFGAIMFVVDCIKAVLAIYRSIRRHIYIERAFNVARAVLSNE